MWCCLWPLLFLGFCGGNGHGRCHCHHGHREEDCCREIDFLPKHKKEDCEPVEFPSMTIFRGDDDDYHHHEKHHG